MSWVWPQTIVSAKSWHFSGSILIREMIISGKHGWKLPHLVPWFSIKTSIDGGIYPLAIFDDTEG